MTARPRNPLKPPGDDAWELAELLEPVLSTREPPLISDGSGVPFAPVALQAHPSLDPSDPAVAALVQKIVSSRPRSRRGEDTSPAAVLNGWRRLATTEEAVLFGGGQPPQMLTAVARPIKLRRGRWAVMTVSRGQQLRAAHERIRASSFRIDPTVEPDGKDTELRLLVTEQTHATGRLAHGRFLTPELYLDDGEIRLRMFVRPEGGFQNRTVKAIETPVRVALPEPIGDREIVDGAVFADAG